MRLSEAMMLGDMMRRRSGGIYLINTEAPCGCAIGGAALAIGHKAGAAWSRGRTLLQATYPWFTDAEDEKISVMFMDVCTGETTFEQLISYVRSIEPDCGECNRFECTCTRTPELQPEVQLVRQT